VANKKKKVSVRRQRIRDTIAGERFAQIKTVVNGPIPIGLLILVAFIAAVLAVLGLDTAHEDFYVRDFRIFKPLPQIASLGVIVGIIAVGAAAYIYTYQPRIIARPRRAVALASLFWLLLTATRFLSLSEKWMYIAAGSAVACAIVLTIAYDQRFAIGMTMFYAILACFAVGKISTVELFLTMMAGIMVCCFSLREIRTRKKLIEVSVVATIAVFITAFALGVMQSLPVRQSLFQAGIAAGSTFAVGIILQAFLPIIESAFGIATSMTLLDYSDANQPLLRKLAMDAPGTFSHSLLIGSVAEAAAESIGANGLLCRVGAYYHDIGKVNKPTYFIENQMGLTSRHEQLSRR
jgi:putative nucleotidyltransferase with HDIG domain